MSDHQHRSGGDGHSFGGLEYAMLDDVMDIAERALWNPAKVPHSDIQKLTAAVVAHVKRMQAYDGRAEKPEELKP